MGSYRDIEGDLLDLFDQGEFEVIAHGCNCKIAMGGGIAAQIKQRYPEMHFADVYYDLPTGYDRLGNINTNADGSIYNLYTQVEAGANASLIAVEMCLLKLAKELPQTSLVPFKVGLPLIGCGIGGLEWEDVYLLIRKYLYAFDVTVVHWNKLISNV